MGGDAGEGIELAGKLKDSGLGADQMGGFAGKLIGFIKEKAGDDLTNKVLSSVPALKKLVG